MPEKNYNQLISIPEGSDWDGKQHRKTGFDSPKAKAAYDAPGLLELARETYDRKTVTVGEALDLRRRGNPVSGNDDRVISLLRRAMAIELTKKIDWEAFVDGLELSDENREKLKVMLTPEAYQLSLSAYQEMGGTKPPPTLDQIKAEIMTWPVDRLRQECEMREQPTVLIVSDRSFAEGIEEMDKNKHYKNANGDQRDAYVYRDDLSPYVGAPKPIKGRVSMSDGVPNPKQLNGVSTQLGKRSNYLTRKYKAAGMRHIDAGEMQILLQRSLIEASKADDMSFVVDNWEGGFGTVTFLDPESLTKSRLGAFSYVSSSNCEPRFDAIKPDFVHGGLRGRASTQVMEF